jgi:WD40 repeat protein
MAISPDGTQVAVDGKDAGVVDAWTGISAFKLDGEISSLTFAPDGSSVVTGDSSGEMTIWDSATGDVLRSFVDDQSRVTAVVVSSDSTRIASAYNNGNLRVWDFATGSRLQVFEGHTDEITCLVYSADSSLLVSSSRDLSVCIWDAHSSQLKQRLGGHNKHQSSCVDIARDGTLIASGGNYLTVYMLNAAPGQQLRALRGHKAWVGAVKFAANDSIVISGSIDSTIRIWDTASGASKACLSDHGCFFTTIAVSPCGTRFFSASGKETIVWDMSNLHPLSPQSLFVRWRSAPAANMQVSSTLRGKMRDGRKRAKGLLGELLGRTQDYPDDFGVFGDNDGVTAVAVSLNNVLIAVGCNNGEIRIWNGSHNRTLRRHWYWINDLSFSSDGSWLASASSDDTLRVWDTEKGKAVAKLKPVDDGWHRPLCVTFSPDRSIIAAGFQGELMAWSTASWSFQWSSEIHSSCKSISFSPDGHLLLSGSDDDRVRVWNAANGECLAKLQANTLSRPIQDRERIRKVAFTDDGSRIDAIGDKGTMRVWDARAEGYPLLEHERFPSLFFIHTDDWLYGPVTPQGPVRCLCWINPDHKHYDGFKIEFHRGVVTLVTYKGVITRFDISSLLNHLASIHAS